VFSERLGSLFTREKKSSRGGRASFWRDAERRVSPESFSDLWMAKTTVSVVNQ